MLVLLRFFAAASLAAAAAIVRDGGAAGDVVADHDLTPAAVAPCVRTELSKYDPVLTSSMRSRGIDGDDAIEICLEKGFKGKYYYYSGADADGHRCKVIVHLVDEHLSSVFQERPKGRPFVRCAYYTDAECGGVCDRMKHGDKAEVWGQPDLSQEPRMAGGHAFVTWYDAILSVQCFWVHVGDDGGLARTLADTSVPTDIADSTDNSVPVLSLYLRDEVVETSVFRHETKRDIASHDNDRLAEIYLSVEYKGDPTTWVTQRHAERSYCVKVKYPKNTIPQSIRQHKDRPIDAWFVCWYYDDDRCNRDWNPNGAFPSFYLQRDESKPKFHLAVKSVKRSYAHPSAKERRLLGEGPAKRDDVHLVTLFSAKGFGKRNQYHYLEEWAGHSWCHTYSPQGDDAISSIQQFKHSQGKDYSCLYYGLPDCNTDNDSFGKRGQWDQPNLTDQPKRPSGNWDNVIQSVRCWYIK